MRQRNAFSPEKSSAPTVRRIFFRLSKKPVIQSRSADWLGMTGDKDGALLVIYELFIHFRAFCLKCTVWAACKICLNTV